MSSENDYREETRITLVETVFVEMRPGSRDHSAPPLIIMCNSKDVSANGIQVCLHQEIPMGSVMRLCVDMRQRAPIFLIGEVRWVQPDEEGDGFQIGFLLFESEHTDIEVWWQEVILDLLSNTTLELHVEGGGRG